MAVINSPYLAPGQSDANRVIRFDTTVSVDVVANATYVGGGTAFTIPTAGSGGILKGLFISAGAPGGTAGGAKTVQLAVGTAVNADADFTDSGDDDVMNGSGEQTAAFVHGDAADDHVDAYFTADYYGKYFTSDLTLYANMLGRSASAGTTPGTVTLAMTIWAFVDYLG